MADDGKIFYIIRRNITDLRTSSAQITKQREQFPQDRSNPSNFQEPYSVGYVAGQRSILQPAIRPANFEVPSLYTATIYEVYAREPLHAVFNVSSCAF